jgi:hypothetical protein
VAPLQIGASRRSKYRGPSGPRWVEVSGSCRRDKAHGAIAAKATATIRNMQAASQPEVKKPKNIDVGRSDGVLDPQTGPDWASGSGRTVRSSGHNAYLPPLSGGILASGKGNSATVFLTERIGRARGAAEKTVCGRGKPPSSQAARRSGHRASAVYETPRPKHLSMGAIPLL